MKNCIRLGFLCACALSAETNYSGVWKANLDASKLRAGPTPANYMVIIQQEGSKITELIGAWDQRRNERRSKLIFNTAAGKPSINSLRGLPMRTKSSLGGRQSRARFRCSRPEAHEDQGNLVALRRWRVGDVNGSNDADIVIQRLPSLAPA
jgi:hypothetical protein